VPKDRQHKSSGQAVVTLNGRDFYLGPYGTNPSLTKYNRLIAEWLVGDRQPLISDQDGLMVAELAARYMRYARRYYVKSGLPTKEPDCIKAVSSVSTCLGSEFKWNRRG
ncbi:MAG TPA: hypothetical protein VHI72_18295, partial [Hyphomicrobiaceae bacterium]|nr:hypothetical protein [Hyphomicrobiaceae bacterium]